MCVCVCVCVRWSLQVYLALKGDKGAMGETKLENARSNFSRASVDTFTIQVKIHHRLCSSPLFAGG